MFVWLLV